MVCAFSPVFCASSQAAGGISPSAEGDQRAPPFGNLPLSRKRPKLSIRGYFVLALALCTPPDYYSNGTKIRESLVIPGFFIFIED